MDEKKAAKRMRLIKSDVICDRHEMTDLSYQRKTFWMEKVWQVKFEIFIRIRNKKSLIISLGHETTVEMRGRRNDFHLAGNLINILEMRREKSFFETSSPKDLKMTWMKKEYIFLLIFGEIIKN